MEIDRDETGSENWEENEVKFMYTRSSANRIKLDNIPDWLLMEVLIRLPVKLVFGSKLVSKQWLSVISDPYFVRMYVSRASESLQLQPWTFISRTMYVDGSQDWDFSKHQLLGDIYCKDVKAPSLYVLRCPSARHLDRKRYMVLGVSNGMVLYGPCVVGYQFNYIANYNICNPITGQWISLPSHAHHFKVVSNGFVTRVENCVLTSYRVVSVNMFLRRSNVITFEVFSSEIGEWKNFNVHVDLKIQFALPKRSTSLNGILHWRTHEHGIMAYDPYHKPDCLRIIAYPSDTSVESNNITPIGISSLCDVHQGRLRYFVIADEFRRPYELNSLSVWLYSFSVWVLNDYSNGDWSLQHRIASPDILYDGILSGRRSLYLKPTFFHPFDADIVYLGYRNIIVSYDIKTRKLEAHGGPFEGEDDVVGRSGDINYKNRPSWWSSVLLVIPPWPVYIPPPSFRGRRIG